METVTFYIVHHHQRYVLERFTCLLLGTVMARELQEEECFVALTYENLDAKSTIDRVRSPKAGAIVLFAGTFHFHLSDHLVTGI